MVDKIAFQSIGGIEGIYLPSAENSQYGSLLTDYGILPAEVSKQVKRRYRKFAGHPVDEEKGTTKLKFIAWLIGTENAPHYKLILRSVHFDFPEWIENNNLFNIQGIIKGHSPEQTILRMQHNPWENYSAEIIQSSINYIPIKNCPKGIKKSQFWQFTTNFCDGALHCISATRLADAKETNKALKAWQTDPIPSSRREELLNKINFYKAEICV